MSKITIKPGQTVPDSGIYINPKTGEKSTLVKGTPAPPTDGPKQVWTQLVNTNPRNDRKR